eukprot:m.51684 g.51684  ORF g.51684 m.51684 type:complete len:102 (+) comp10959_c0_seq2:82-387(+)
MSEHPKKRSKKNLISRTKNPTKEETVTHRESSLRFQSKTPQSSSVAKEHKEDLNASNNSHLLIGECRDCMFVYVVCLCFSSSVNNVMVMIIFFFKKRKRCC